MPFFPYFGTPFIASKNRSKLQTNRHNTQFLPSQNKNQLNPFISDNFAGTEKLNNFDFTLKNKP